MSFGKGGGTTYQTAQLTPAQQAQIEAQTQFSTGTVFPAFKQIIGGAQDVYTNTAPGVGAATQNLQGMASQAQRTLGETGESALRTGISGLENLFGRDYEAQQIQAAMLPAQQQYQQNLAGLEAGFGGAGQLGSARQALAQQQLAGTTQAQQAATAAQVANQVAAQRLAAGQTLAQLGQGGIGQALGAAGQGVTAAMTPQDYYNKYVSAMFGTPQTSYTPDFRGTQGTTTTSDYTKFSFNPFNLKG